MEKWTWGPGLYQDDRSEYIREEYLGRLGLGMTNQEATKNLFEHYEDYLFSAEDYGIFTMGLANIQWWYGKLLPEVKEEALKYIDSEMDYKRWDNSRDLKKRKQVLNDLTMRLNSPQPPEKKIKRIKFRTRNWNIGDIIIYKLTDSEFEKTRWHNKYMAIKVIGYGKLTIGGLPSEYYHEVDAVEFYGDYWESKPTLKDIEKAKLIEGDKYLLLLNSREMRKLDFDVLSCENSNKEGQEIILMGVGIYSRARDIQIHSKILLDKAEC